MRPIPLRWKLTLFAWALAGIVGLILIASLIADSRRDLLRQIDLTLETKCDEVITLLTRGEQFAAIERFFAIETSYRFSKTAYFYQISDSTGRILARSENLGDANLDPIKDWRTGSNAPAIDYSYGSLSLDSNLHIRIRSELVDVSVGGTALRRLLIQTAGSLEPIEKTVATQIRQDLYVAAFLLATVFLLLWFAVQRALQPIVAMVSRLSAITANNLKERLPTRGAGDELDTLADVINSMLDRLGASLQQTEAFASDASHQVRTRLARVRGELELLIRRDVGKPLRDELVGVHAELEQLSHVCSRLLLVAQLDRHVSEFKSEKSAISFDDLIEVRELVAELVEQLTPIALESGVTLRQYGNSTAPIRGNRSLIVEALLNLLDNAIRFSAPSMGPVSVTTKMEGARVRVSITDSGPGIPLEERARVFERFYRSPAAPRDPDRSGLGLAIVRSIADLHDASVEVADREDGQHGSVFSISFGVAES